MSPNASSTNIERSVASPSTTSRGRFSLFWPPEGTGLFALGMMLYNVAAVAILAFADLGFELHGLLLWTGVVVHAPMAVWCILCLARFRVTKGVRRAVSKRATYCVPQDRKH